MVAAVSHCLSEALPGPTPVRAVLTHPGEEVFRGQGVFTVPSANREGITCSGTKVEFPTAPPKILVARFIICLTRNPVQPDETASRFHYREMKVMDDILNRVLHISCA